MLAVLSRFVTIKVVGSDKSHRFGDELKDWILRERNGQSIVNDFRAFD